MRDADFHRRALEKVQLDTEVLVDVVTIRMRELRELRDYTGIGEARALLARSLSALQLAADKIEEALEHMP